MAVLILWLAAVPHGVISPPLSAAGASDGEERRLGGGWRGGRECSLYTHSLSFQKMELALVPLSAHGNFYEGDCYVILSVSTTSPISMSPSPESQFWGSTGRSHEVNQDLGICLDNFPSATWNRSPV